MSDKDEKMSARLRRIKLNKKLGLPADKWEKMTDAEYDAEMEFLKEKELKSKRDRNGQ